jgi:glycosyltransferase involved in cell wall biosynthesis
MNILLAAYACEPHCGSEPGIGWNIASILSSNHQVTVLTTRAHQLGIEQELDRYPNPNLRFVYCDPGWFYDLQDPSPKRSIHLHYALWQWTAYHAARRLHQRKPFDIVHQATYGTYLKSSQLWRLPVPFVWGPLGGAEATPSKLLKTLSAKNRKKEIQRNIIRSLAERNPWVKKTLNHADVVWAATPDTSDRLRSLGCNTCHTLSSLVWLGSLPRLDDHTMGRPAMPLRFISIGRLLGWKGFHLGLEAFAASRLPNDEYWIVGDGAEMEPLQQLAQRLGISDRVKFLGKLTQPEALAQLRQADVLIHPSLHDSGGFVCLEAMALGKPVVCLNVGGPALQVTPETGYLIEPRSPDYVRSTMADIMVQLSRDPALRQKLGYEGIRRIRGQFSVDSWHGFLENLYAEALGNQGAIAPVLNAIV